MTRPSPPEAGRPAPAPLRRGLRVEVLRFKERSPRGLVPPTVWAGLPGGPSVGPVPADGAGTDAHLRMETALVLSDRARSRVSAPLLWLTRAGPLDPSELDSLWWSAVRATWEEQGLRPAFAVVTRQGWRLEPGDLRQEWRRLR